MILHNLPSIDAIAFMSSCKMILKLAEIFWGPIFKYLPLNQDNIRIPEPASLTLQLNHTRPLPRIYRRWDQEIDCLRVTLDNLQFSAEILAIVRDKRSNQFHGMIQAAPKNWHLIGCYSSMLKWPKDSRHLRVFLRGMQGKDYVSGMQFLGDDRHEIVGFTSPTYNDIHISRKKHIVRFVIDDAGIRSLNCGDDSPLGWSSDTPESIRCWEGCKSFEQSSSHDYTILVIFDVCNAYHVIK